MDDRTQTLRIAHLILSFLDEEFKKSTTSADSKESIEVAMQCLETAFNINLQDTTYKSPVSMREILRKYDQNDTERNTQVGGIDVGPKYVIPDRVVSEDDKKQADDYKNRGNEEMKNLNFEEAVKIYTKAIELDGSNAVYFCNRAAAYLKVSLPDKALRDCQIAIQLQPSYARAYGRMGVIFSSTNDHIAAAKCYRKAVALEPENESYVNNLRISEQIIQERQEPAQNATQAARNLASSSPQLASFFNNPQLLNMASQMLRDPNMQQMMERVVEGFSNQAAGQGAGGIPGAGMPGANDGGGGNLEQLLNIGQAIASQIRQAHPDLADMENMTGNPPGNPNYPPDPSNRGNN